MNVCDPMLVIRKIAPVFDKLREFEKNDETALKFMSIVDYDFVKGDLYDRIQATNQPKLLHELLGFHSYKSFVYYNYIDSVHFDEKYLKCRNCEFFGPYALTLTHMAINHNIHNGFKQCAYCNHENLDKHFQENSFYGCYMK